MERIIQISRWFCNHYFQHHFSEYISVCSGTCFTNAFSSQVINNDVLSLAPRVLSRCPRYPDAPVKPNHFSSRSIHMHCPTAWEAAEGYNIKTVQQPASSASLKHHSLPFEMKSLCYDGFKRWTGTFERVIQKGYVVCIDPFLFTLARKAYLVTRSIPMSLQMMHKRT